MLLTDWLKRLSTSRSILCAPSRNSRRLGARVIGSADVSSHPETLEKRTLLSAANILLTNVSGATGFQISGASPGGSNFGNSIKPAGDVNGDGFEDVIIGAYYENVTAGSAYVIFGKSNGFSPPPDLDNLNAGDGFAIRGVAGAIPGPADYAGTAVSGAGDVNGDGFDDILVATSKYAATADGSAGYVIFGKESNGSNADVDLATIDTGTAETFATVGFRLTGFGSTPDFNAADATATGGDINGDGYDDIVFGGPRTNVGASYGVGAAYVVFGKESGFANLHVSQLNGSNGFRFTDSLTNGDSNQAYIGSAVSIGGDINGDGFDDLVVGAPKLNAGTYGVTPGYDGKVFVIFGDTSFGATVEATQLNGTNGFEATGVVNEQATTGASVSSGGDVNGDGIDDFVIGAPGSYDYAHVEGRAYVVFGKTNLGSSGSLNLTTLSGTSGFILNGAANYDVAGTSVNITGDINGDGFEDIVVGAPTKSSGSVVPGATNGQAYVMFGRSNISASVPGNLEGLTVDGTIGFKLSGSGSYHAGQRVTSGADINGDGFDELFIGEPYSSLGTVTVFFGTDFDLNDGNAGDGELGNGLQKIDGSGNGSLLADAGPGNADILVGGGGDDTLTSDGGSDVLIGGSGDDVLTANLSNFSALLRFDGGTGVDTLASDPLDATFNGATIDLTGISGNRINDVEVIDLEDGATETLTLDLATVLAITGAGPTTASSSPFAINDAHTLVVLRDADDTINIGAGWTQGANEMIDGKTFEVFTQDGATVKIQQVSTLNLDVDENGSFEFQDGILIALSKLNFDGFILDNRGSGSSLSVSAIKTNVTNLGDDPSLDVDENGSFEFQDGILIALSKLNFDGFILDNRGSGSSLSVSAIKTNVSELPDPPSARPAPLIQPPEDQPEPLLPETPSFIPPPPQPFVGDGESLSDNPSAGDESSNDVPSGADDTQSTDETFELTNIDVTMDLLS